MAQPVFPTLTAAPVDEGYSRNYAIDNRIVTPLEDGRILSMKKYTDVPLRWTVIYRDMTETDYETLMAFYEDDADWGNTPIKWTDLTNSTDYFVYFDGPPDVSRKNDNSDEWRVTINFLEALGSYT